MYSSHRTNPQQTVQSSAPIISALSPFSELPIIQKRHTLKYNAYTIKHFRRTFLKTRSALRNTTTLLLLSSVRATPIPAKHYKENGDTLSSRQCGVVGNEDCPLTHVAAPELASLHALLLLRQAYAALASVRKSVMLLRESRMRRR